LWDGAQGQGYHTHTFQTLFGTCKLSSPHLSHCRCQPRKTAPCRPLTALLPESVAPARLCMETQWASLVSNGVTVDALTDLLPRAVTLDVKTVRHDTLQVAHRYDVELGEEQGACVEGGQRAWEDLPIPDGPMPVGIDGGYVREWEEKKRHCEVIVGTRTRACTRDTDYAGPSSKRLGFVQPVATKPQRRLYEGLKSQSMQMHQPSTFLSDGGDPVRDLPLSLSPEAEHMWDWFPVTMQLTVLDQYAKGLVPQAQELGEDIRQKLERLTWSLWHGNLDRALTKIDDIASLLYNFEATYPRCKQVAKAVEECCTDMENIGMHALIV